MSKDNGGPAFPTTHEEPDNFNGHNNSRKIVVDQGMTLRDYFAAKAMQGFVAYGESDGCRHPSSVAHDAYAIADAMLQERTK